MDELSSKPSDDIDGRTISAPKHPHDAHGHFVHVDHTESSSSSTTQQPVHPLIEALVPHGVGVDHRVTNDDLVDVHVGNPLRKITALLEEIKKQKAFSFNIRGSLGLAGIVLVIGTFGFFGGTKALCSKGVQSEVGVLKELDAVDSEKRVPVVSMIVDVASILQGKQVSAHDTKRIIVIKQDSSTLHIPYKDFIHPEVYGGNTVIVTGEMDSCSEKVTIDDARGIQIYK